MRSDGKVRAGAFLRSGALLLGLVSFCLPLPASGAGAARILTLEECLALAEENHPDLAGAEARIAVERHRLSQTAAEDRMRASGSLSASRRGRGDAASGSYSAEVTASLKVFDSNRTRYAVDARKSVLKASEAEANGVRLRVRTGVKTACMGLLLALEVREQRRESVKAFERHLERARGYYETGLKPKIDVTKAEVELGRAQLALTEAASEVELAGAALRNAMGVASAEPFEVRAAALRLPESADRSAEALALEHRQDYKAAVLRTIAGRAEVRSAARHASPSLSLRGGYAAAGEEPSSLESSWNAGLALTFPIVDGGETAARVGMASGQLGNLEAAQEALRQDILLEVRKAVLSIRDARERIRIAGLTVVQAEENHALAEGRYRAGVGASLEISDALLTLTEARLSEYRARHDLQVAQVALERATGLELTEPDGVR